MLRRWLLAVLYLGLCFALVFLLPAWLRVPILLVWAGYVAWTLLTLETAFGRSEEVRPLTRWDVPGDPAFRERLRVACQEMGIAREPIWAVLEDDEADAWAIWGLRGMVVFTTGLLKRLGPDELLAVAGHELRHLRSRDSLPALLCGSWLTLLGWLSAVLKGMADLTRDAGPASLLTPLLLLGALVLDVVLGIVGWAAAAVLASRSRQDEHLADLAGARISSAGSTIAALDRVGRVRWRDPNIEPVAWSPRWITLRLHASHPTTEDRVAFLAAAVERGELRV